MTDRKEAVSGFFHVGVTVESLERSLSFYRDGLGLSVASTRTLESDEHRELVRTPFSSLHVAFLSIPGGGFVELMEFKGVTPRRAQTRPSDYGVSHLALYVHDLDATVVSGRRYGGELVGSIVGLTSGPLAGTRVCYLGDPDGHSVELLQRPDSVPDNGSAR